MSSIMAFSFLACFDSSFLLFPMPCALNFFCPHFLSSQQQRNHNLSSVRPTVKKKKETSNIYFLPENHQLFLACSNSLFLSLLLHAPFPPVDQKLTIPGSTNSFECPGGREREEKKNQQQLLFCGKQQFYSGNCCNITSCTCFWFGCIKCIQTLTQVLKPNYVTC